MSERRSGFSLNRSPIIRRTATGAPATPIGGTPSTLGTLIGVVNVQTSIGGVGNGADATDDTLFTYTLPANALAAAGQAVRVKAWGMSCANTNVKTAKVWFGSTAVAPSSSSATNGVAWFAEAIVVRTGATTQDAIGEAFTGAGGSYVPTHTQPGETLSGGIVIKATGASGASAANDVVGHGFMVEVIN